MHSHSMMTGTPRVPLEPRALARMLLEVAHPNIEELLCVSAVRVSTKRVDGKTLGRVTLGPRARRETFAVLAGAIAHLHACGWSHGSLDASKVLVVNAKTPVVTGFEHAIEIDGPRSIAALADVRALGHMMAQTSPSLRQKAEGLTDESTSTIASVAQACIAGDLTAADAARLLAARKSFVSTMPKVTRTRAALAVAVVAAATALGAAMSAGPNTADAVAEPIAASSPQVLTVRTDESSFAVDATSSDKLLLGSFDCEEPAGVLLRSQDRSLWLFASLPDPQGEAPATRIRRDIEPVDIWTEQSGACERLGVMYADGSIGRIELER